MESSTALLTSRDSRHNIRCRRKLQKNHSAKEVRHGKSGGRDSSSNECVVPPAQQAMVGPSRLRIYPSDEKEHDASSGMTSRKEDQQVNHGNMKKRACIEVVQAATSERNESALRNRDALTMISAEDLQHYADKYVVIVRLGERSGQVVESASTLEDAIRAAQKLPGYRPQDYWVRFIGSTAENETSSHVEAKG